MSSIGHDPEKPLIAPAAPRRSRNTQRSGRDLANGCVPARSAANSPAERRDAAAERSPADYECPAGVAATKSTSSSDADGALPKISINRRLADAGRSAEARVPANSLDRECQRLRLN